MKKDIIYLSVLANKIAASKECIEPFKSDAIEAIENMEKLLPHGSGIDGTINFDLAKSSKNKIVVFFEYHHMNENGYYDSWTHHNLILTPSFANGFDMRITGPNKNQCKDYFYELFSDVFTIDAPNTKVTKVYTFEHLTPQAQEKVLDELRETQLYYEWWESTYEGAKNIGIKITSFDLDRNRHANGELLLSPEEVCANIIRDHGTTCETYKTAQTFLSNKDSIIDEAEKDENGDFISLDTEDELIANEEEFIQAILEDYSIILQNEFEYLQGRDAIIETINSNEYTFTEDGKMENI